MTLSLNMAVFVAACLLLLSIVTSKVAARLGVPVLLLFLVIGMALGSDGPGGIAFDDPQLTQHIGMIALAFILFSGGLETEWATVRGVWREGVLLSTVGVLVTALTVGAFARVALGFDWLTGILLGATVASTDAAAVFAILRGKNINLKGKLAPVLELESGSNDPMAVFLVVGILDLITMPSVTVVDLVPMFMVQMSVGLLMGVAFGEGLRRLINRIRLEYDGLYPVLTVAAVLLVFGATALLDGNSFLAVYVAGLTFGRQRFIHQNSLVDFHSGVAWLMQITMFLTLGLQVFPSRLVQVIPQGLVTAAVLVLVARPVGVWLATWPTSLQPREKLYIAWVGLRGAAPIILATFTQLAAVEVPLPIFDLVFFVVLVSVMLQGTTLLPMARRLGLLAEPAPSPHTLKRHILDAVDQVLIPPHAKSVGQQLVELGLPPTTLVVLIRRQGVVMVPRGSSVIEAHDELLVLVTDADRTALYEGLGLVPAQLRDNPSGAGQ